MWAEFKAILTGISIVCLFIVMSQIIFYNILLGFLLFVAIGLMMFGDIIFLREHSRTHANLMMERPPSNKILIPIFTLSGLFDLVWAEKRPDGKREFVFNKQEATVIDRGDYPIHNIAGAHGCIGHEACDENVNMYEVKAAEQFEKQFDTADIKEIYRKIDKIPKDEGG